MALLDDIRSAALAGRTAVSNAGLRAYTVWITHETAAKSGSACPLDTVGATYTVTKTQITPSPYVVPVDEDTEQSWLGGGLKQQSTGRDGLDSLLIGPITQSCPTGGYDVSTLAPTVTTVSERYMLVVNGPGLETISAYGGVPYEIRRITQPTQQQHYIHATRAPVYPL